MSTRMSIYQQPGGGTDAGISTEAGFFVCRYSHWEELRRQPDLVRVDDSDRSVLATSSSWMVLSEAL